MKQLICIVALLCINTVKSDNNTGSINSPNSININNHNITDAIRSRNKTDNIKSSNDTNTKPNPKILATSSWVRFTLTTNIDEVFNIRNFQLPWGHLADGKEISEIENAKFDILHQLQFKTEGAPFSPTGTSGSYDIYHFMTNIHVAVVKFDCPWSAQNVLEITSPFKNPIYLCSTDTDWSTSGALGNITITCKKTNEIRKIKFF